MIKNSRKEKYNHLKDNIWGAVLVDMQLISKFDKGIRFLLCFSKIFSKYAFAIELKDKRGIAITNALQEIWDEPNPKPNKI